MENYPPLFSNVKKGGKFNFNRISNFFSNRISRIRVIEFEEVRKKKLERSRRSGKLYLYTRMNLYHFETRNILFRRIPAEHDGI